ncbi:MAG: hypothetical protein KKA64_03385 [Nanoarchaeota archaeon]|nr:hypothetical protein [Nanoarchaeota archaeon]
MAICNSFLKESDDELVAAAQRGEFSGIKSCSPEIQAQIERNMPAVERAKEERTVECLQENVKNGNNELKDRLAQSERTDIEKLDLRAEPTDKECREAFRIGREIKMESWEIANSPVIMGIKDPETLGRIPNIRDTIKEEMGYLHQSKLSPWFRDSAVADRIVIIDKNQPGSERGKIEVGDVLKKGYFTEKPELSRVVHIFRDGTGKLPEGQRMHWVVVHEMCHLNFYKGKSGERDFAGIFVGDHHDEWIAACNAQLDKSGVVSDYAKEYISGDGPREFGFINPEFIAENIAAWDTNLVEVCSEMQSFFDKYLT